MLGDKKSEEYDAALVAQARLHLSNIVNGHMSELFFDAIEEIIKRKIYLGYRNLRGKNVKLSGIKDFFYNFHHGLGIKNIPEFLANCVKIDVDNKSRDGRVRRFITWLHKVDPDAFQFPDEYWELRRLHIAISIMKGSREKKQQYARMARIIYMNSPETLKYIGPTRKYKTIPKAYVDVLGIQVKKNLGPIKLYDCPTVREVEELARELYSRLDKYKVRVLIGKLIEVYRLNDAIEKHLSRDTSPDDDEEI